MDDSEYETAVARYLADNNPEFEVSYNYRVLGCKSGVSRQVDVLLTKRSDRARVVVECKYYRRKLDIKLVEAFIGFLQDVDILDGILVTNVGLSKAAIRRISECPIRIRVLAEADLSKYRIGGLIPWQARRMAFLAEPNGWLFSDQPPGFPACCVMTPIGRSFMESFQNGSFLYMNLMDDSVDFSERLHREIQFIDGRYPGKKTHAVTTDGNMVVRRSYISARKRYDLGIFRRFSFGTIMIHGILARPDLLWTITCIKKALVTAKLCRIEDTVVDGKLSIKILSPPVDY